MKNSINLFLLLFSSTVLFGQEHVILEKNARQLAKLTEQYVESTFSIDVEQDYFVDWWENKNFDRNYTQGTAFSYSQTGLNETFLFLPFKLIDKINEKAKTEFYLPSTISFGVTGFTPLVIDSEIPIEGDRPFAGLVYLSTTTNKFNLKTNTYKSFSFSYGLFGTNVTNAFQSFMHKEVIKGRPHQISWQHQVSRGGHLGFLLTYAAEKSLFSLSSNAVNKDSDWLTGHIGFNINVGWYTGIAVPLTFRIGNISSFGKYGSSLNNALDFANKNNIFTKINIPNDEAKEKLQSKIWETFAFLKLNPRITAYNSFILGQPHVKSIYTLSNEEYLPFLIDFQYGLVISRLTIFEKVPLPIKRFDIILTINHRSPEINNDKFKRWHHWGRVTIRFPLFKFKTFSK